MGALLPLLIKYGLPALMRLGPLLIQEIERRQAEAETGRKIQHAFYDEQRRLTALSKEELLKQ